MTEGAAPQSDAQLAPREGSLDPASIRGQRHGSRSGAPELGPKPQAFEPLASRFPQDFPPPPPFVIDQPLG